MKIQTGESMTKTRTTIRVAKSRGTDSKIRRSLGMLSQGHQNWGHEGRLPFLPFARRGGGGAKVLFQCKEYYLRH